MNERYFGVSGPEPPAMVMHRDLEKRQAVLDTEYDGLAQFGVVDPDIYVVQLEGGHTCVVVDQSVQPDGAFKYYSSAASVATVPEGTREVVTFTAGNFGKTLGRAALCVGMSSRAFAPYDLNRLKEAGMEKTGMKVAKVAKDVAGAGLVAKDYVDSTPGAVLLHPFNNPWGMAGLRYMGSDISTALRKLATSDHIDLGRPTDVVVPRGGGSGVSGVASSVFSDKQNGNLPGNVSVYAVRPSRLSDGSMNPLFDGLRVAVPGSNAQPFLEDRRFVRGTRVIDEAPVADASRLMAEINSNPDVMYEPNALISLGAIIQWVADNPNAPPRNFVAVLTGRNTDPDQHSYFTKLAGYKETEQYQSHAENARRRKLADTVWRNFQAMKSTGEYGSDTSLRRSNTSVILGGAALRK